MSVLTYIASNYSLPEKHYPEDFCVHFNLDTDVIDDGGRDDSFELIPCMNYDGVFTKRNMLSPWSGIITLRDEQDK